jgi:hypothetical protein
MEILADRLTDAQRMLLEHGFSKQHERIFSMDRVAGDRGVQCVIGFDDADAPGRYQVHVRCLERPVQRGRKGADIGAVRVIDPAEAPAEIRSALEAVLAQLGTLAP